jgi:uncharacterized UPF0146 family protein
MKMYSLRCPQVLKNDLLELQDSLGMEKAICLPTFLVKYQLAI